MKDGVRGTVLGKEGQGQTPAFSRVAAQGHLFPFRRSSSLPNSNFMSPSEATSSLPSGFIWSYPTPPFKRAGPFQSVPQEHRWLGGACERDLLHEELTAFMEVPASASHYTPSVCANLPAVSKCPLRGLFNLRIHLHLNCPTRNAWPR